MDRGSGIRAVPSRNTHFAYVGPIRPTPLVRSGFSGPMLRCSTVVAVSAHPSMTICSNNGGRICAACVVARPARPGEQTHHQHRRDHGVGADRRPVIRSDSHHGCRRCLLRGMRSATVIAAADPGIRLATTTSLTLAAAKAADVVDEQRLSLAPRSSGPVGRRVRRRKTSARTRRCRPGDRAGELGVEDLLHELSGQAPLEAHRHRSRLASPTRRGSPHRGFSPPLPRWPVPTRIGMRWPTSAMTSVGLRTCSMPSTTTSPTPETGRSIRCRPPEPTSVRPRRLPPAGTRHPAPLPQPGSGRRPVAAGGARRRCGRLCRRARIGSVDASGSCSTTHAAPTALTSEEWPIFATTRPPEQSPGGPNQPPFPAQS